MKSINENEIKIDVFFGPIGSCGFRRGHWKGEYKGAEFKFYASIPHQLPLDEQRKRLRELAARHLGR